MSGPTWNAKAAKPAWFDTLTMSALILSLSKDARLAFGVVVRGH